MSEIQEVRVPDLGDIDEVEVIEILVSPGDSVAAEDGLITLESDKASMDVPSPRAGRVAELRVEVGDKVAAGSVILTLETAAEEASAQLPSWAAPEPPPPPRPVAAAAPTEAAPTVEREPPPPSDIEAEVAVLGAGPAGYTAAFRAADLGKKVVLIERYPTLGGVCLNVGCIPSKTLLHAGRVLDEAAAMAEHGLVFGEPRIDLARLRSFKEKVVGRLTGGLAQLAKRRKVEVVQGVAKFTSPHQLEVSTADGPRTVGFEHAIVAAGSRVIRLPGIPWEDPRVLDSTGALALEDIPRRLLVVGGGIIGLEMATVYSGLGSEVSVVELTDTLMPGTDRDLVKPLQKRLGDRLAALWLSTRVTRAEAKDDGLEVFLEGEGAPASAVFDRILVAVGRRPNGDSIGAEAAGLEIDERGFLKVDRQQRTNVPHIFAVGDIVGEPMLAHKGTHEGKVAAEVIAGLPASFDARVIPSVAYTDPEVAWVGLTEAEAERRGIAYGKGTFPWVASGRSLGQGRDEGMTKLLFDEETQRILGAGIVGTNAGDLISEAALAIEMDCEAADLALTIHPHPTLSETVGLAAEAYEGTLTDLYLPKRKPRRGSTEG